MLKINVSGETKIFRKDWDDGGMSYTTSIGKKKQDGTWDNGYIAVQFKKDVKVDNGTMINIPEGGAWLSFYFNKENRPVWYIFVNVFEGGEIPDGFSEITDLDDVPF